MTRVNATIQDANGDIRGRVEAGSIKQRSHPFRLLSVLGLVDKIRAGLARSPELRYLVRMVNEAKQLRFIGKEQENPPLGELQYVGGIAFKYAETGSGMVKL